MSELKQLKERMEYISGEWNGDEPGRQEENAHIAEEVIQKIDEIDKLLEELR